VAKRKAKEMEEEVDIDTVDVRPADGNGSLSNLPSRPVTPSPSGMNGITTEENEDTRWADDEPDDDEIPFKMKIRIMEEER
jgi:hypothetical protein